MTRGPGLAVVGVDESKLPPPDRRADGIAVIDVATLKPERALPGGNDGAAASPRRRITVGGGDRALGGRSGAVVDTQQQSSGATEPRPLRQELPETLRLRDAELRGRRIDQRFHRRDLIGWEATHPRMLAHHLLVRRDVDAVDLVVGDVALNPLDLRSELIQDVAGAHRDRLQLVGGQLAGTWNQALDDVLWHGLMAPVAGVGSSDRQ